MAREAKTIYTIDPGPALAAIQKIEAQGVASAKRMAEAFQAAMPTSRSGGGGGTGGSRGGGGGGTGGSSGDRMSAADAAVIRARMATEDKIGKSYSRQELAVGRLNQVENASEIKSIERHYAKERRQVQAESTLKRLAESEKLSDRQMSASAKQRERDEIAANKAIISSLTGVEKIRAQQAAAKRGVQSPQAIAQINSAYEKRIATANIPKTTNDEGFIANFRSGFGRAGGMGSALATTIKYGAAYKAIEAASTVVMAPLRITEELLKRGTKAWFEYDTAMASAERTMQMPGMKTGLIKQALGADALEFMTRYNASVQDVGKAIYELGSAGADSAEVMQTWQIAAKLNIALDGDMTQTTRLLTQMMKIHGGQMDANLSKGEQMARISGVIAKTWQIEQVELSDLSASYKYVAASAGTLGIKMEEVIPLIGFLSTYGLRGSIAGTGLNQMLTQLSRTAVKAADGMLEFRKATRGGEVVVKTAVKYDSVHGPVDMLKAIANAAKLPDSAPFMKKLDQSGIISTLANIRGARPLQVVLTNLAEFLRKVGDTSHMTTKQLEDFTQSLVDMQQNTPEAQIAMLNRTIDIAGQTFITSAMGAYSFVDALKSVRQWIVGIMPDLIDFGARVGGVVAMGASLGQKDTTPKLKWSMGIPNVGGYAADWVAKPFEMIGKAGEAGQSQYLATYMTEAKKMGVSAYLNNPSKKEWSKWKQKKQSDLLRKSKGDTGGRDLAMWYGVSALDINDIVPLAKTQKLQAAYDAANTPKGASLANIPKIKGASGGGGRGGGRAAAIDYIQLITDGVDPYNASLKILESTIRGVADAEDYLKKMMGERLITNADILESDKLSNQQIDLSNKTIAVLTKKQAELAKEKVALGNLKPSKKTAEAIAKNTADAIENVNDIEAEKRKKKDAERNKTNSRITLEEQKRGILQEAWSRSNAGRENMLDADKERLAGIDRIESLYGVTIASQTARINAYADAIAHLSSKREKDEAKLAEVTKEHQKYADMLANGQKTNENVKREQETNDQMAALGKTIVDDAAAMADFGTASKKTALEMDPLATALDLVNSKWEILKGNMEAKGIDWATSPMRGVAAMESFVAETQKADKAWNDLVATQQGIADNDPIKRSADQMAADKNRIYGPAAKAFNEITQTKTDLRKAGESLTNDIQDMQDSRGKGDGSANRAIERKYLAYKESYQGNKPMLDMSDQWHTAALADIQLQKYYKKREEIEQQWGTAFMKFFTDLQTDGKDALKSLWESIIGSIQEQIMQQFVGKMLAGLFDSMAASTTGVDFTKEQKAVEDAAASAAKTQETMLLTTGVNPALAQMTQQILLLTTAIGGGGSVANWAGESGPTGAGGTTALMQAMGGFSGSAGGSSNVLSMMSGNGQMNAAGKSTGSGGLGAFGGSGAKLPKWVNDAMQGAAVGSMAGGVSGSLAGRDPASSSNAGAIGGAIGGIAGSFIPGIGTAVGSLVGGLVGGLFGKKKKAPAPTTPDPNRSMYGMPEFEWDSYLYGLYGQTDAHKIDYYNKPELLDEVVAEPSPIFNIAGNKSGPASMLDRGGTKAASAATLLDRGSNLVANNNGDVTINVNGGDEAKVLRVVNAALVANFGPMATATVPSGRAM